jgi:hypothetical protein
MLVIRDALLSQLQKDRLRQDIIMAELARIERAMALRSAGGERADPVRFPSNEHFVAHSGVAEHGVGADEVHDLKKNDGVAHDGVGLEPEKPAMEDHAGQCFKTCCSTGKMACQENAALDECKMQESSQVSTLTLLSFSSDTICFASTFLIHCIDSSDCCLAEVLVP